MYNNREEAGGNRSGSLAQLGLENTAVALAYWGLAHLTFTVFQHMGILPMPIWPSAAVAIVVAFYRGWRIGPGIAAGTLLANHYSLGGPWAYAACIALMNTVGPLVGAWIMRRRVTERVAVRGFVDLLICFVAAILLAPMLTAVGGVGFKWLFGLAPAAGITVIWLKWTIAHSLGSLLFATPVFAWMALKEPRK
jgi:integral membrane sensor domain MASE1